MQQHIYPFDKENLCGLAVLMTWFVAEGSVSRLTMNDHTGDATFKRCVEETLPIIWYAQHLNPFVIVRTAGTTDYSRSRVEHMGLWMVSMNQYGTSFSKAYSTTNIIS